MPKNNYFETMSHDDEIPLDTPRLLEFLKSRFPNRCARSHMTDREVWIECGEQNVLSYIESALKDLTSPKD